MIISKGAAMGDIRKVVFPSGISVPALGQGTWYMGESAREEAAEVRALQLGIDLGMTLIDTAEMYANGGSEKVVGKAIAGRRQQVYLVSKVLPSNATRRGVPAACEASLRRLGTDYLDLYLYHWRGGADFSETIEALEKLVDAGKIRHWGVSNLDVEDMDEWVAEESGDRVQTNQVLYNLTRRGIEFDLVPWLEKRNVPIMAYSPIEQGRLLRHPALAKIAQRHGATPAQIALAWVMRKPNVIAIPKAASEAHVRDNRASVDIVLTPTDLAELDAAFPPPTRKRSLEML
ncbi:MAG TPA: aldo/keto reductase [Rhodocyclaceae bacterium]|nr:aldo/keto reductase [Rhodocyclaceae bacterium]